MNWIIVDGERSTSLIKGVGLGVVQPGGRVRKRIIVICSGVKGERVVDVEVLTRIVESGESFDFRMFFEFNIFFLGGKRERNDGTS